MTVLPASLTAQHPGLKFSLDVLRRRLLLVGLGTSLGWAIIAGLTLLIAGAWLDLALDFPGGVRAFLALLALLALLFVTVYRQLRVMRTASLFAMARSLDDAATARGQIVAGLDLASTPPKDASTITTGLAQMATRQAVTLLVSVPPETVAPARGLRRPAMVLAAIAIFLLLIGMLVPRLVGCQLLRFADPFGDHPPYSALVFAVQPGNTSVVYGGAVDVQATTSGAVADHVDLVFTPSQQAEQIIPMFPEGAGKWRATLVELISPGQYSLRSGRSRSERFGLAVITVPQIQKVTFRVTLPAYTNRPPYEGPLPQTGLSGLPGTKVLVTATSNRPLSGGHIALTAAGTSQTIPLTASGGNDAIGQFEIRSPGKLELKVTDVDKQQSTDSFSATLALLTDEKPFVRIVQPFATSFATPDATVKVLAIAEDDYGISKLQIYRGLNDSRFRATDIPVPTPAPTQLPGTTILSLGDYGLSPGDVIKVFARTQDNDPAGPKGGESSMVTIHVVSQQDMDRMSMARNAMEVLQSKYAQAARKLEAANTAARKLGDELAKLDPTKPLSDAEQKKLDQLAQELAQDAQDVDKLAAHDLPVDLDKALKEQLSQMSAQLREASQMAHDAGKPGISIAGALDKLDQIKKKLGDQQEQFKQNTTIPLQYLAKILPVLQDQMRFIDIYNHQKDLAERLDSLKTSNGQDDPQLKSRRRDLRDEQHQVRDDLQQCLDDIDNHVNALPDDKQLDVLRDTARQFAQAVRNSPADGQMQNAETALDEFSGSLASTNANAAAETLNQFITRCQSMGNQGGVCLRFQPKLAAGLGDTVNELLSMSTGSGASGSGSGYTAMRSTLMNVGLYGAIPMIAHESSGGGGQADRGIASRDQGSPDGNNNPDASSNTGQLRATGAGEASVPPQYKKSVGEYFQRVDDELSQ